MELGQLNNLEILTAAHNLLSGIGLLNLQDLFEVEFVCLNIL